MNSSIQTAAALIQQGELVAFPTETVYGLGADMWNPDAIAKIYATKGRPSKNPLIVHIAEIAQLDSLVTELEPLEKTLIAAFWPGPLTLVLPKRSEVSQAVTGGLSTVAVRMPAHPMALELIRQAGVPIAAPSANLSGKPSATHHQHVRDYFGETLFVLEGGATEHGLESTVLQVKNGVPHIYRLGSITPEDVERATGVKAILETNSPHSPGTQFKHYAPSTPLILMEPEALLHACATERGIFGVIATTELLQRLKPKPSRSFDLGAESNLMEVGAHLYEALIEMDRLQLSKIFIQSFPEQGLGRAIMDRLRRASGENS